MRHYGISFWHLIVGRDGQLSCWIFYTSTGRKWHKAEVICDKDAENLQGNIVLKS